MRSGAWAFLFYGEVGITPLWKPERLKAIGHALAHKKPAKGGWVKTRKNNQTVGWASLALCLAAATDTAVVAGEVWLWRVCPCDESWAAFLGPTPLK